LIVPTAFSWHIPHCVLNSLVSKTVQSAPSGVSRISVNSHKFTRFVKFDELGNMIEDVEPIDLSFILNQNIWKVKEVAYKVLKKLI
jgi:hypothetical protein